MEKTKTLRKALWANVIFSEITAVLSLFFAEKWIAINDLTQGKGVLFGIMLLIFSSYVAYAAWRKSISHFMIWSIIVLDLFYVLGVIVRLVGDPSFSTSGYALTLFTGIVVLTL
ncbi:MAG: hypothetical protein R3345_14695, partial [Fulvivirga sp.]|nr:hypothetical protein [Fulvivirga sp.]